MPNSASKIMFLAVWLFSTTPAVAGENPASEARDNTATASTVPVREPGKALLKTAGIRELSGKYLTLYTDLPASSGADRLVDAFDQAYSQWCSYFGLPEARTPPWRATACLMRDKKRFAAAGLVPADLPAFDHAYFRGNRVWIYEQKDGYYQRHLLLHEGTHAFMNATLGSCGPPWFMEGIAELLATHALDEDKVALNRFPGDADDVPGWGRVRLVHDALKQGRRLKIDDVLTYDARAHEQVEPYGWCWAAAAFLDGHPRYQEHFRKLAVHPDAKDFNERLRREFATDWPQLAEEWQLFVEHLEYGYDLTREAIDFRPGKLLAATGTKVKVAADRGWQSTGLTLEAGKGYRLRATGRFQVASDPQPWPSGPAGVTIRYWEGKPLGMMLAAVHPEPFDPSSQSSLLKPIAIGEDATIEPAITGTLYLRINDSPAELNDNAGSVEVRISAE
jgi:hypothetical protein